MKTETIYLRYNKKYIWNFTKIFDVYADNTIDGAYKMKDDMPLFVNVEGSYVRSNDIKKMMKLKDYLMLKDNSGIHYDYKWKRDSNGIIV